MSELIAAPWVSAQLSSPSMTFPATFCCQGSIYWRVCLPPHGWTFLGRPSWQRTFLPLLQAFQPPWVAPRLRGLWGVLVLPLGRHGQQAAHGEHVPRILSRPARGGHICGGSSLWQTTLWGCFHSLQHWRLAFWSGGCVSSPILGAFCQSFRAAHGGPLLWGFLPCRI
jgi:hypothetical protein